MIKGEPFGLDANLSMRLIAGRLGSTRFKMPHPSTVEGTNDIAQRLIAHGGFPQQERMIRDKRRSLDKATLYSYQACRIKKIQDKDLGFLDNSEVVRALINPDKNKQDYDDKIISIGYEHGYQPGDVFEWVNTNSYWLIYLQDKTELAYFRGEIRRCRYTIKFKDEDGNEHFTYAAVRGPVETKINFIQKSGISVDKPNHSLNILLPANKYNIDYFYRYSKFYLIEDVKKICWRVEGMDWISTPGILQVNAVEYYSNEFEDDIENGIAGGLIMKEENPNENKIENLIQGDTFIKPKGKYIYKYMGTIAVGEWTINTKDYPLKYRIIDEKTVEIQWTASHSGQFDIMYGINDTQLIKTIVVESLF